MIQAVDSAPPPPQTSRWFPKTLKARATLILCGIFLLSHGVSLLIYEVNRDKTVVLTEATDLAARIVGIVNLARSFPGEDRQRILAAAETQFLATFPMSTSLEDVACQENEFSARMAEHFREAFRNLAGYDAAVCVRSLSLENASLLQRPAGFDVLVSVSFPDGQKSAFHAVLPEGRSLIQESVVLYLIFVAVMALLVAWYMIRKAVAPLEQLADAADKIGVNIDSPAIDENGPYEVALAARAFNRMQARLGRLVHGQTEMLAAISHDLRSAVTRLQLRAELLENTRDREGLLRVVKDMRLMIQSVIDFVRGHDPNEEPRRINMTALVESLCEDLREEGYPVSYESDEEPHPLLCRPTALRRGVHNLIDNAIKYGGSAKVSILRESDDLVIRVWDSGPGIPEDKLESVLRPFYRLEKSRSQDTGGVGLGLAISQNIVQAHGGLFTLCNLKAGGLEARIRLPINAAAQDTGASTPPEQAQRPISTG